MKEALSWVIERQYDHCILETDSNSLAMACNGTLGEAFFGNVVTDCIQLLKHICPVLVEFSYRSANRVAHMLAQATSSMSDVA